MSAATPIAPRAERWRNRAAGAVVIAYALITLLPILWIVQTGFKTPPDSIAYPPKLLAEPSLEGYVNLFTTRSRQTPEYIAALPRPMAGSTVSCARATWWRPARRSSASVSSIRW